MRQSTTFACLLAMLGVLRYPARRSRLVAKAAAWLVTRKPRHAYTALSIGGHFLSLLFNVGILPLIGDMIRKAGGRLCRWMPPTQFGNNAGLAQALGLQMQGTAGEQGLLAWGVPENSCNSSWRCALPGPWSACHW